MERDDTGHRPSEGQPAHPEKMFARQIDCAPAADRQPAAPSGRGDGSRREPPEEAA